MKNRRWLIRIAFLIFSSLIVYRYAVLTMTYEYDDAYITYRYAWNVATYRQLTYNLGERVLATTSPLQAIVLAPFGKLLGRQMLPVVARASSYFWVLLAGFVIFECFHRRNDTGFGLIASVSFLLSPYLYIFPGLETNLFIFLLILAIVTFFSTKWLLAGIVCAVSFLARGDGLCLILILGCKLMVLIYLRILRATALAKFSAGASMVLIPWMIFSRAYYGRFLPTTILTKVYQGKSQMFGKTYFASIKDSLGPSILHTPRPLNILLWVGLLAFLVTVSFQWSNMISKRQQRSLQENWQILLTLGSLVEFGVLQFIVYSALGVGGNYRWYQVPLAFSLTFSMVGMIWALVNYYRPLSGPSRKVTVVATLLTSIVLVSALYYQNTRMPWNTPPPWTGDLGDAYLRTAEFLNNNTAKSDVIALAEAGMIGFYLDRNVFDQFGVVTPQWVRDAIDNNEWEYPPETLKVYFRKVSPAWAVNLNRALDPENYYVEYYCIPTEYKNWVIRIFRNVSKGYN